MPASLLINRAIVTAALLLSPTLVSQELSERDWSGKRIPPAVACYDSTKKWSKEPFGPLSHATKYWIADTIGYSTPQGGCYIIVTYRQAGADDRRECYLSVAYDVSSRKILARIAKNDECSINA